jgi:hypothetical protein
MILILYHKYFYIFSQSCFLGSENDTLLGRREDVCVDIVGMEPALEEEGGHSNYIVQVS